MRRLPLDCLFALCILAPATRAELFPAEVAIIAARGNAQSEQLAAYYAQVRGVPVEHICLVDLPAGDECPRETWEATIRHALRAWLAEHDPKHKLRCLVTIWGVPLAIGAAAPTAALAAYEGFLVDERRERFAALRAAIDECNKLAPASAITTDAGVAAEGPASPGDAIDDSAAPVEMRRQLENTLEAAFAAAQARIAALPEGVERDAANVRLQQLIAAAGGAGVIVQNLDLQLRARPEADPALQAEFHRIRGGGAAWNEARQLLEQRPPSIDRDVPILALVDRMGGHLAVVAWLDEQIAVTTRDETAASFDSELALIHWPAGYELLGSQPNYLHSSYDRSPLRRAFPTLMVARLDAPTFALAKELVDAALAAERDGLRGTAYFDARGLAAPGEQIVEPRAPAAFDGALLATAAALRDGTNMEVVLDDKPPPFPSGACPDAALYCGWYSLGKYVDAFAWQQGAIAYHLGGGEAARLHDPDTQRWCKRLLEDGVAATIGAVDQPQLASYPRPDEFFAALVRGDLTLAEAYWQTLPRASDPMALLGDPLYRPFKNRTAGR